jgi:hypothetical protein
VLPKPRTKAAAEMESELKLLAAASIMPGRAISCLRRAGCPFRKEKQRSRCKASRSRWAASVAPVRAISCERAEQQPVLFKPRAKAAAEMESELKPLAVASVTPVWAISCVRAEQQPVLPWPKTKEAAEMENELKLLASG